MPDDNPSIEDLGLSAPALSSLLALGYRQIDDLRLLSNVDIVRIPNVGGQSYRRILVALGRSPPRSISLRLKKNEVNGNP